MEAQRRALAVYLSIGVEMQGAAIIGIALMLFIAGYIATLFRTKHHLAIWVLGSAFAVPLPSHMSYYWLLIFCIRLWHLERHR